MCSARSREPEALGVYWDEVGAAAGADARLDDGVAELRKELDDLDFVEARARRLVERMAIVFQGALLVRHAPPAVADAFCASRLAGDSGRAFGTLPPGVDTRLIVDRPSAARSSRSAQRRR